MKQGLSKSYSPRDLQSVTALTGETTGGASGDAVISGNGALVVFDSLATNLTPNDTNNQLDVFRVSRR